jgi:hypothetical protein
MLTLLQQSHVPIPSRGFWKGLQAIPPSAPVPITSHSLAAPTALAHTPANAGVGGNGRRIESIANLLQNTF